MDKFIQAIQAANKLGSDVYGGLNEVYNSADRVVGGNLPYGVPGTGIQLPTIPQLETEPKMRMAGERIRRGSEVMSDADSQNPITKYIDEIPDKGGIPIVNANPTLEAITTAAKYAAGPLGAPFRIIRSPGTAAQLQKQVDGASVRNGKLYHGLGESNYEETRFPSNIQGAGIVGQFIGTPELDNTVTVTEPYDTLGDGYHNDQFMKNIKNMDLINTAESAGNIVFRGLDDIGWANKYPRGKTQVIGELKPGHPYYRGGPAEYVPMQ